LKSLPRPPIEEYSPLLKNGRFNGNSDHIASSDSGREPSRPAVRDWTAILKNGHVALLPSATSTLISLQFQTLSRLAAGQLFGSKIAFLFA
jgi:hypothetical protein